MPGEASACGRSGLVDNGLHQSHNDRLMRAGIREIARNTRWLYALVKGFRRSSAYGAVRRVRNWRAIRRWHRRGRPIPAPSAVKYEIVKLYGQRYGLRTLVETGTYNGGLIHATARR